MRAGCAPLDRGAVGVLFGLVIKPYGWLTGRRVRIGQVIGWADLNLIASLQGPIFRPFVSDPRPFVAWSDLGSVTHRVGLADRS